MHRDSIFYRIFSQDPTLLFDLLTDPPPNAIQYQFDSVAVKEPRFEIDKFIQLSRVEIEAMLDVRLQDTRVFQEAKQEGIKQGEKAVLLRMLNRKFGTLPDGILTSFHQLSLQKLETLSDALLEFRHLEDLQTWLEN